MTVQGSPGIDGTRGEVGPSGEKGENGDRGPVGEEGVSGPKVRQKYLCFKFSECICIFVDVGNVYA